MSLTRRAFVIAAAPAGFLSAKDAAASTPGSLTPPPRSVLRGLVGRPSGRHGIVLEAVSAAQLPHTLVFPAFPANTSAFFEWREYRAASPACLDRLHRCFLGGGFAHCGIQPLLWERSSALPAGRRYLFPFGSLAARAEAWTAFASDPAWSQLREFVQVTAVSVYRRLAGGITLGG